MPEGVKEIGTFSAFDPDYEKEISFKLDPIFKDSGDFELVEIAVPQGDASQFSYHSSRDMTPITIIHLEEKFSAWGHCNRDSRRSNRQDHCSGYFYRDYKREEIPFFENNGTRFLTNELSTEIFAVTGDTDDFNKSLTIGLSHPDSYDNFLFEHVEGTGFLY